MNSAASLYIARNTPIHACDARVKILLLLAYTIAIFFADTLVGVSLFAVYVVVTAGVGGIPVRRLTVLLIPVAFLSLFAVFFNAINADVASEGLLIGVISAVRMMSLAVASFVVCFTTTSTDLVQAFSWLLVPLTCVGVPVGDIALVLSLALRFIPMVFEELARIRDAQASRGAHLSSGPVVGRMRAWGAVFVPLFVGLFRRADRIAIAMDSRCYCAAGSTVKRTSLSACAFSALSFAQLSAGIVLFVVVALLL